MSVHQLKPKWHQCTTCFRS